MSGTLIVVSGNCFPVSNNHDLYIICKVGRQERYLLVIQLWKSTTDICSTHDWNNSTPLGGQMSHVLNVWQSRGEPGNNEAKQT